MGSTVSRLRRSQPEDDTVEAVVCRLSDLEEKNMKVCQLSDAGRVLVVKHAGTVYAVGAKCSHYGAPLERGVLSDSGKLRCPWHGACFNVTNGDIEDFPGLDNIPSYSARVAADGSVVVRASRRLVQEARVCGTMSRRHSHNSATILVLGAGGAGASCVEGIRRAGFTGRVVMASADKHRPYDRPKLSKALDIAVDKIYLRSQQFYQSCDVEIVTEHEACQVDTSAHRVHFTNGASLHYTQLVIATGSRPRVLSVSGAELSGIFTLRNPEDGHRIAQQLADRHVVIVGTGFIGMEVAAFCCDAKRARSVTLIGNTEVPLQRVLGARVGAMLQQLLEARGVRVLCEKDVARFCGDSDGRLTHVVLSDDTQLPADVCVLGVGTLPNSECVRASAAIQLDERGFIIVDKHMRTSCESVWAAGDVASFPLPLLSCSVSADNAAPPRVSIGHWQVAHYLGRLAADNAVTVVGSRAGRAGNRGGNNAGRGGNNGATDALRAVNTVPFFWTQLLGKSIRYAGYGAGFDEVLFSGSVEQQTFTAFYCRGAFVTAVASMGADPAAAYWADRMASSDDGSLPSRAHALQHIAAAQENEG